MSDHDPSITLTTLSIVVTPTAALATGGTSPLYNEQSTIVTVVDEAGGPFLEIESVEDAQKIRLGLEELEAVLKAARHLMGQKQLEKVTP